jgi:hypothetical protein
MCKSPLFRERAPPYVVFGTSGDVALWSARGRRQIGLPSRMAPFTNRVSTIPVERLGRPAQPLRRLCSGASESVPEVRLELLAFTHAPPQVRRPGPAARATCRKPAVQRLDQHHPWRLDLLAGADPPPKKQRAGRRRSTRKPRDEARRSHRDRCSALGCDPGDSAWRRLAWSARAAPREPSRSASSTCPRYCRPLQPQHHLDQLRAARPFQFASARQTSQSADSNPREGLGDYVAAASTPGHCERPDAPLGVGRNLPSMRNRRHVGNCGSALAMGSGS